MLYFSRWKATGDPADGAARLPVRGAEFLPEKTREELPKWAQRHIVLGLDLQGGSHILLEVDTNAVRKAEGRGAARRRAPRRCATRLGYTGA